MFYIEAFLKLKTCPRIKFVQGQSYKTFYDRNLQIFVISQRVCSWQVSTNIRLDLKGLPWTKTLAYKGLHFGRLQPCLYILE